MDRYTLIGFIYDRRHQMGNDTACCRLRDESSANYIPSFPFQQSLHCFWSWCWLVCLEDLFFGRGSMWPQNRTPKCSGNFDGPGMYTGALGTRAKNKRTPHHPSASFRHWKQGNSSAAYNLIRQRRLLHQKSPKNSRKTTETTEKESRQKPTED